MADRILATFVSELCVGELLGAREIVEAAQIPVAEARFLAAEASRKRKIDEAGDPLQTIAAQYRLR